MPNFEHATYQGDVYIEDVRINTFETSYIAVDQNGVVFSATSQDVLEVGSRYAISGQVTEPNRYQAYSHISAQIDIDELEELECDAACSLRKQSQRVRRAIETRFHSIYCHPSFHSVFENCGEIASLAKALVFGGDISTNLEQGSRNIGISHILVVSGWQIALIVSFVEFSLEKQAIWLRVVVLSLLSVLLLGIVGVTPPVLRALLSSWISVLVVWVFGRNMHYLRSLWYSTLLILLLYPTWVASASLHLSVLASVGVYLGSIGKSTVKTHVFSTIGATLAVLPYSLYLFGFSPYGIIANILLLPLVEVVTLLQIMIWIPLLGEVAALLAAPILILLREASYAGLGLQVIEFDLTFDMMIVLYLVLIYILTRFGMKPKKATV